MRTAIATARLRRAATARKNIIRLKSKLASTYKTAEFDPELSEVIQIILNSGISKSGISQRCGVSTATLNAWLTGKTRRPQNITISFVAKACGFKRKWERTDGRN